MLRWAALAVGGHLWHPGGGVRDRFQAGLLLEGVLGSAVVSSSWARGQGFKHHTLMPLLPCFAWPAVKNLTDLANRENVAEVYRSTKEYM